MAAWRVLVGDRFGNTISNITPVCFGKQLIHQLNRPAQFSFWVPSSDASVAGLHIDGAPFVDAMRRTVRAYRQEKQTDGSTLWVIRFAGHIWQLEDAGDAETMKTAVTCFDPLQLLSRRVARKMVWRTDLTTPQVSQFVAQSGDDQTLKFTLQDQNGSGISGLSPQVSGTEIARGLLNATNYWDGYTGLGDYYHSWRYRSGGTTLAASSNESAPTSGDSIDQSYDSTRVVDQILAMTNMYNGFDLEVVPTDTDFYTLSGTSLLSAYGNATEYTSLPAVTTTYRSLGLLRYYAPGRGTTQDNVVFGYGTFPRNVSTMSHILDGSNLTNLVRMFGVGIKSSLAKGLNSASVQQFPVGMDATAAAGVDITNQTMLNALASEEATLGGGLKRTVSFSPRSGSYLPFDDFNLGDWVHVNAGIAFRGGFVGLQRVYGYTLDISDDHLVETLSNVVTSDAAA